jgi:hypothetical protein
MAREPVRRRGAEVGSERIKKLANSGHRTMRRSTQSRAVKSRPWEYEDRDSETKPEALGDGGSPGGSRQAEVRKGDGGKDKRD